MAKLLALLPQTLQPGDKIRLSGNVAENGKFFSIYFVNDTCEDPENITYHFKWTLQGDIISENYKSDGVWSSPNETYYNVLNGNNFNLEFAFIDDTIYVYHVQSEGHNLITQFESEEFNVTSIEAVQVWGDVAKINDICFSYA